MTGIRERAVAVAEAEQVPWYDLIDDVPEPPEDGMQQYDTIIYILAILGARYADDPNVLVAGSAVFIVYDSATPGSVIAPDAFVVFGVPERLIKRIRRLYRIEEWGPPPAFVLEVASESTAGRDVGVKREIYARMGAREYWRMDPSGGEYYGEALAGERLVDGEYERIGSRAEEDGGVWARSEVLGVDFYWRTGDDGYGEFLIRDSKTGEWLGDLSEERAARLAETEARLAAEARARELEAEVERLRELSG